MSIIYGLQKKTKQKHIPGDQEGNQKEYYYKGTHPIMIGLKGEDQDVIYIYLLMMLPLKYPRGWFELEETTEGYYRAFKPILEQKGRPVNIYTDKRGTFVINQGNKRGETQFARAMKELDINMITAHSPQAKGRVERAFYTLQERLV